MPPRKTNRESAVLVVVKNGDKVLDSGTGTVLCHEHGSKTTFVLTCAHNLRATKRRLEQSIENTAKILVNGNEAHTIADSKLESYDLAVLEIPQIEKPAAHLKSLFGGPAIVFCEGFIQFIHQEYAQETVTGKVKNLVQTLNPDGLSVSYFKVQSKKGGPRFTKGLSGGPVYDTDGNVIGISRVLQSTGKGDALGYAIQFSAEVVSLIRQIVTPCIIEVVGGAKLEADTPPPSARTRSSISERRRHSEEPMGRPGLRVGLSGFRRKRGTTTRIFYVRCSSPEAKPRFSPGRPLHIPSPRHLSEKRDLD